MVIHHDAVIPRQLTRRPSSPKVTQQRHVLVPVIETRPPSAFALLDGLHTTATRDVEWEKVRCSVGDVKMSGNSSHRSVLYGRLASMSDPKISSEAAMLTTTPSCSALLRRFPPSVTPPFLATPAFLPLILFCALVFTSSVLPSSIPPLLCSPLPSFPLRFSVYDSLSMTLAL